jgi:histidinol-phosphatase (PHP family)
MPPTAAGLPIPSAEFTLVLGYANSEEFMKIRLQDLHIHTEYSCDSRAKMMDMCQAALDIGIDEIGFTDHMDLIPDDPCAGYLQLDPWWDALEICRTKYGDSLIIKAGIEIGEPHRYADQYSKLLDAYPWDYALGSLHWVGDSCVFHEEYFTQTEEDAYRAYFTELGRMALDAPFDILAHTDVVKRYGYNIYGEYDPGRYETEIRRALRHCVERGIVIEINTSTLRWSVGETSPTRPILDWYKEEGGEAVTLGSDAHQPKHVGSGMQEALSQLEAIGISRLASFSARSREDRPLSVPNQGSE